MILLLLLIPSMQMWYTLAVPHRGTEVVQVSSRYQLTVGQHFQIVTTDCTRICMLLRLLLRQRIILFMSEMMAGYFVRQIPGRAGRVSIRRVSARHSSRALPSIPPTATLQLAEHKITARI